MHRLSSLWTLLFVTLLAEPDCLATDRVTTKSGSDSQTASVEQIASWIRQLDSPRFAERTEATRQLDEAGRVAFCALAEAALGESREVSLRAIEILRKHTQDGDAATKAAARESLQKIASSDRPSTARRAKEALTPSPPTPTVPNIRPGPIMPLPVRQGQIQVQVQVNAFGGNQARRIEIRNGVQKTEINENDLKVRITEDAQGGIQMEVTRKKDGKETAEKYSAKSAEVLKKTHPDAAKLYEKYRQQLGTGMQIRVVPGVPVPGGPVPAPPQTK